jgi:hypothetical protein
MIGPDGINGDEDYVRWSFVGGSICRYQGGREEQDEPQRRETMARFHPRGSESCSENTNRGLALHRY